MRSIYRKIRTKEILYILFGTALMAVSANFFFDPAGMVPGGFTGLAMLLDRVLVRTAGWHLPLWLGNVLLNIPLILCSIKIRGWRFMQRYGY